MTAGTSPLPSTPFLDPRYEIRVVRQEYVFFLADKGSQVVRGELFARLVPAIDGHRTLDELVEQAAGLTALDVEYGVRMLLARELLEPVSPAGPRSPNVRSADLPEAPPLPSAPSPGSLTLAVEHLPGPRFEALGRTIARLGLRSDTGRADLLLVPVHDYQQSALAAFNRRALQARQSWMPVKPWGREVWIGPVFDPGRGACWKCLAADLERNRPVVALLSTLEPDGSVVSRSGQPPAELADLACAAALAHAGQWLRDEGRAGQSLWTLSMDGAPPALHSVLRRPGCPACGEDLSPSPSNVVLESKVAGYTTDGGFRTVAPAETAGRLRELISPLTGWIRAVEPRHADGPPWVYVAKHSFPIRADTFEALQDRPRVASAGKGGTREQAEVSALAEAVERSSSTFWGDEPLLSASRRELGESAVDPFACLLFSEWQLARRQEINLQAAGPHRVPPSLRDDEAIDWTEVWSLSAERRLYLPTSLCYTGYRVAGGRWSCRADSNGCAAGNCTEEAILQGLLELVERDAVSIWWHNRLVRPTLVADAIELSWWAQAREAHSNRSRRLHLLDLTHDLGIPVVAAVSLATRSSEPPLFGFGAHLSARLAISRAVSEVHQFLEPERSDSDAPDRSGIDGGPEWLLGGPAAPCPPDAPFADSSDLKELVHGTVQALARAGLETLVLDQSRPGLELKVVRTVVPGLRPWWRRLAPGRLYEVPVFLGWLECPTSEGDLNTALLPI